MSLPDDLPVSESLAVFLGVAGFQWLTAGRAGLVESLLPALLVGIIIFAVRRWRQRKHRPGEH